MRHLEREAVVGAREETMLALGVEWEDQAPGERRRNRSSRVLFCFYLLFQKS